MRLLCSLQKIRKSGPGFPIQPKKRPAKRDYRTGCTQPARARCQVQRSHLYPPRHPARHGGDRVKRAKARNEKAAQAAKLRFGSMPLEVLLTTLSSASPAPSRRHDDGLAAAYTPPSMSARLWQFSQRLARPWRNSAARRRNLAPQPASGQQLATPSRPVSAAAKTAMV